MARQILGELGAFAAKVATLMRPYAHSAMTSRPIALDPSLPKIGSLWIGDRLGLIEQLTLLSFLAHGHDFTLFTTQAVASIPAGIRVRDANEIFPCQHIVRDHKTASPAIHADMFRYAMLAKTDLMWVDMDVLCLRPFRPDSPYVFGYEDARLINNAVLRLPPDSPTLNALLRYQPDTHGYPAYFSAWRKAKYWLKSGFQAPHISRWPWGAIGPKGLSHYLKHYGEDRHALTPEAFYWLECREVSRLLKAGALQTTDIPSSAYYLHLWAKELRLALKQQAAQEGSWLHQEQMRLGALFDFTFT